MGRGIGGDARSRARPFLEQSGLGLAGVNCRWSLHDDDHEYVEARNGGYYVAGTRIGLDVVTYDFRNGRSPEAIFDAYLSIGSLAKVYGAITFILEHPKEIEAYLEDQDRRYEEIKTRHPLTPGMIERFERAKSERAEKQAEELSV